MVIIKNLNIYETMINNTEIDVSDISSTTSTLEENVLSCGENIVLVKPDYLGVKKSKLINKAINDYVEQFLSSIIVNGSTDNLSLLNEWKSKDNQDQLNGYIHQNKIKMKKKVDTDEPKKPSNEFTYFSVEMRHKIKSKKPEADAEIIPMIAKEWNDIKHDPEKLQKYKDMAFADKKRFDDELNRHKMIKQKEENRLKLEKRLTKMKERNDKKILKAQARPKSSYYFFIQDEKPKIIADNPSLDKKAIHVEMQKKWKTLKTDDPTRFQEYKRIAEEKAKEMPPPPVFEEKKKKKYETPSVSQMNDKF